MFVLYRQDKGQKCRLATMKAVAKEKSCKRKNASLHYQLRSSQSVSSFSSLGDWPHLPPPALSQRMRASQGTHKAAPPGREVKSSPSLLPLQAVQLCIFLPDCLALYVKDRVVELYKLQPLGGEKDVLRSLH